MWRVVSFVQPDGTLPLFWGKWPCHAAEGGRRGPVLGHPRDQQLEWTSPGLSPHSFTARRRVRLCVVYFYLTSADLWRIELIVGFILIRMRPSALECLNYEWFQVCKQSLKDLWFVALIWFVVLKWKNTTKDYTLWDYYEPNTILFSLSLDALTYFKLEVFSFRCQIIMPLRISPRKTGKSSMCPNLPPPPSATWGVRGEHALPESFEI